jgi:hypothetical protein
VCSTADTPIVAISIVAISAGGAKGGAGADSAATPTGLACGINYIETRVAGHTDTLTDRVAVNALHISALDADGAILEIATSTTDALLRGNAVGAVGGTRHAVAMSIWLVVAGHAVHAVSSCVSALVALLRADLAHSIKNEIAIETLEAEGEGGADLAAGSTNLAGGRHRVQEGTDIALSACAIGALQTPQVAHQTRIVGAVVVKARQAGETVGGIALSAVVNALHAHIVGAVEVVARLAESAGEGGGGGGAGEAVGQSEGAVDAGGVDEAEAGETRGAVGGCEETGLAGGGTGCAD